MLDIRFIQEHPDVVRESQRKRGESVELVDEVLKADSERRAALQDYESYRAEQKSLGKRMGSASPDEKADLLARTKSLSDKVNACKAASDEANARYTDLMWKFSNVVEPEAPEGGEDDYVVVKKVGTPRDFAKEGFEPKNPVSAWARRLLMRKPTSWPGPRACRTR